jgi:response regulator RpfG family c-di-GMP phosphodiesterase
MTPPPTIATRIVAGVYSGDGRGATLRKPTSSSDAPAEGWCYEEPRMARVLVIEDEADLREILSYNLSQAGHHVKLVARGREGLATARVDRPDVVLLDLMLPDMSGIDVCKAIKQDHNLKTTRVIMVTAKG